MLEGVDDDVQTRQAQEANREHLQELPQQVTREDEHRRQLGGEKEQKRAREE
jgi:hypothetical protein